MKLFVHIFYGSGLPLDPILSLFSRHCYCCCFHLSNIRYHVSWLKFICFSKLATVVIATIFELTAINHRPIFFSLAIFHFIFIFRCAALLSFMPCNLFCPFSFPFYFYVLGKYSTQKIWQQHERNEMEILFRNHL